MADSRKTEKPTPKKIRDANEKGQFPRSMDLTSTIELGIAGIAFYFLGAHMMNMMRSSFYENISAAAALTPVNFDFIRHLLVKECTRVIFAVLPFAAVLVAVALIMGAFQVGRFRFSEKAINPDISRLNPVKGFSRFFTVKSWVEMFKGLFKFAVVAIIVYLVIETEKDKLLALAANDVDSISSYAAKLILEVNKKIFIFMIILGVLDYVWQRFDFMNNLKMTKQEVKEEMKNTEGDIQAKSKIKSWFRRRIKHRVIANVKKATFVAVNPTHYAVAVKYVKGMPAPQVVSKGVDELALRIKQEAAKWNIPVIENPPLAREIYATTEIGKYIPAKLFKAVAKILAFLYRTKRVVR